MYDLTGFVHFDERLQQAQPASGVDECVPEDDQTVPPRWMQEHQVLQD